jgi:hypothetical protein
MEEMKAKLSKLNETAAAAGDGHVADDTDKLWEKPVDELTTLKKAADDAGRWCYRVILRRVFCVLFCVAP